MSDLRARAAGESGTGQTDIAVQSAAAELATALDTLSTKLASRRTFFVDALAKSGIDADLFLARVMNDVRKNPELLKCTFASLMGATVTCAQVGLMPGPLGHFYLTPRQVKGKFEVVGVIGYRGYMELARRAVPLTIDADARYSNDHWLYRRGTNPILETSPPDDGPRGDVLGYWAAASWAGGLATHYMSGSELERHAKRYASNSVGAVQGFARQNYDAWCRKTVLRQMAWKLPQSTQMALALETDEAPTYWRDDTSATVTVHTDGRVSEHDPVDPPAQPTTTAEPPGDDTPPGEDTTDAR